ncbi:TetR/AcrR family transcriptional regulator [Mycolicibacterium flavescens]|uniref:TetR family transcriptional regulator n=1 Tax=Mycolicibacterium flavescens TaxID=1776 RepID=A0A1E3RHF1_MYCFV|nr:TetR/AcrR family transcriptional regulator [Mycolicibacterium flavescens]MCV7280186.1 TetR/AcrR family transcriptional regulator [Mycolicibacterium flavescens]ODQ89284.1 TetR family transcriptional regulator [Mycolicibacterium flavescens]
MPRGRQPANAPKTLRAAQAEATRAALITTARRLFVEKGYFSTSIEDIVGASGVGTRGALYHHFEDKRALFQAVFEQVEEDLIAEAAGLEDGGDALTRLRSALLRFLDASLTPEVQRILLIDGPAVLDWQTWRQLEGRYGIGAIHALLERAVLEGSLPAQPLIVLSHVLLAAVDEAALVIANSPEPTAARQQGVDAISLLLAGLDAPPRRQ